MRSLAGFLVGAAAAVAAGLLPSSAAADAAVQIRCGGWTHGHELASVRIRPRRVLRITAADDSGYVLEQTSGASIPLPRASLAPGQVFALTFMRLGRYRFAAHAASCRRLTLSVSVQPRVQ
jgi:hypothetical protein